MNLRLITSLTLCLSLAAGVSAQTAAPAAPAAAPAVTTTVTGAVVSQYMFRGVRLGGASFQPAVEVGAGNLAVGLWSNFPMKDKVEGQSDPELDVYGSYKIVFNDTFNLQPGFTWYNYPQAEESNGFYRTTFEPSLAANVTLAGITFTPKVYYDLVLDGPTYELNAFYALPLKAIGSELDFTASAGTFKWTDAWELTQPKMKNWGDYWLVGVAMPYQVTKNSKLTVGVAYTKGSGNYLKQGTDPKVENSAAVGRGVVTVAYAMTF
ncbi:TorF family putative porin [Opitutus sp. ER46]|uniref:TorF family putative porin n=1 Tax=Opitutus sp. ER46 TaxID=2161864 RepID=UPI001304B179|nr:TorF family putative porin [Opitutus sp. ER46]